MSDERDDAPVLDSCGCCDGLSADTPIAIDNPPGLPSIRYRPGTHATFRSSMLARLVNAELEPDPLLGKPAAPAPPPDVRSGDDFSAALIDAFAGVADVLTFYAERIANESYLRTATERRSVLELARTIGYELKPGVAASAPVKLVIDEPVIVQSAAASAANPVPPPLREAPIPAGTKVQSVPAPNEKAQTFETIEDIVARPEWNDIRPRGIEPNDTPAKALYAEGEAAVKAGDVVVVENNGAFSSHVVAAAAYDREKKRTAIVFDATSTATSILVRASILQPDFLSGTHSLDDIRVQRALLDKPRTTDDLRTIARLQQWPIDDLERTIRTAALRDLGAPIRVHVFGVRAALFGHNSPDIETFLNTTNQKCEYRLVFGDPNLSGTKIDLDATYPGIAAKTLALLVSSSKVPALIDGVQDVTARLGATSGKVTRLALKAAGTGTLDLATFTMRETIVHAQSTAFDAGWRPLGASNISGDTIVLEGVFVRLEAGRKLAFTGARADAPQLVVSEVRVIKEAKIIGGWTEVVLTERLEFVYLRDTVTISANVATATHGETVEEILGDGDASIPYQSFTLRQPPLTYVSDPATPGGAKSTLEVRVDDILWTEVPSLYGHGPRERIYTARLTDDGRTVVQFGDGITGARVPTGLANVRAKYRKGIGLEGLVQAEAITLLMSRPLGLKGASNPLPSAGAADPEPRDEARTNAPLTVLTLDRVVSLRDYEDYARGYAGVAKALATEMRGREQRGIFITVAGPDGRAVRDTAAIEQALHTYGSPHVPLRVRTYGRIFFRIFGTLRIEPAHDRAIVLAAVERALRDAFSFRSRNFGQAVHLSEVAALVQNVPGVLSAAITHLQSTAGQSGAVLRAALPFGELTAVDRGAELLLLDPRPLDLQVTQ